MSIGLKTLIAREVAICAGIGATVGGAAVVLVNRKNTQRLEQQIRQLTPPPLLIRQPTSADLFQKTIV